MSLPPDDAAAVVPMDADRALDADEVAAGPDVFARVWRWPHVSTSVFVAEPQMAVLARGRRKLPGTQTREMLADCRSRRKTEKYYRHHRKGADATAATMNDR